MKFPCTACGCCCRAVVAIEGVFPSEWVGRDGACVHLGDDNMCRIYESRPECCRVGFMFKESGLSESRYVEETARVCNALMRSMGVTGKEVKL